MCLGVEDVILDDNYFKKKKTVQKGRESRNQAVFFIFGYALAPVLPHSLEEFAGNFIC